MNNAEFPATQREWHWRVLALAWPIILSNLSVPLVGIVDTAVVGQIPDPKYMASVAVGATLFSSVFWIFGFLRMGTTGFVSQAMGANNAQEVAESLLRAIMIALVLSAVVIVLQSPIVLLTLSLMNPGEALEPIIRDYFDIRIYSAPATFINYCILGCLIGLQKMRWALMLQLVLNGSNLLLDVIFVLYMGMDSAGVAWASLISEYLACFVGLWLLRSYLKLAFNKSVEPLSEWFGKLFAPDKLKAFFEVNGNLFLRTLFLTAAFFFFTSRGAQFGVVVLAANAILINLLQMLAYGLDGFAQSAEALTGGAYGVKNRKAFQQAVKVSTLWAGVAAILIAIVYALLGQSIVASMTVNPEVIATALQYLPWLIAAPIIAVWSYQFDGIFTGAMDTRTMRNTVLFSAIIYVGLVYLLTPSMGNHGLWLSMMIFLGLRGLTLGLAYPKLLKSQSW